MVIWLRRVALSKIRCQCCKTFFSIRILKKSLFWWTNLHKSVKTVLPILRQKYSLKQFHAFLKMLIFAASQLRENSRFSQYPPKIFYNIDCRINLLAFVHELAEPSRIWALRISLDTIGDKNRRDRDRCILWPVWPDWAIFWTVGNILKPLATINLPQSFLFLVNYCKGVKIIHFSSETIFGQLL